MNKLNVAIFKLIVNAASTFKGRVNDALLEYRKEMIEARAYASKFKAEDEVLSNQKSIYVAKAQERIQKARRMFASDLERYVEQLSDQLQSHVSEPLDAGFRDQLLTIAQFGLKPSKTQIEALLKANNGNEIGIEALAKVLSDVGSPYRVQFRGVEEYEKDLAKIRRLMVDPIAYDIGGDKLHPEAVEVMSGLEQVFVRDDGTTYTRGAYWDSTSLLMAQGAFDIAVEEIETMQHSWISDVTFRAAEAQNAADDLKAELLASVGAESEQAEDFVSGTKITDSDAEGLRLAQELGKERARANAPMSPEARAAYVK